MARTEWDYESQSYGPDLDHDPEAAAEWAEWCHAVAAREAGFDEDAARRLAKQERLNAAVDARTDWPSEGGDIPF